MAIAIYVIVGLIVVAIILWVIALFFARARMQHYVFAHQLLPTQLFFNPTAVLVPLVSGTGASAAGRQHLVKYWNAAAEGLPEQDLVSPDTLEYSTEVLGHPNSTAFLLKLPKRERKTEAHFALIVFDAPGLCVGKPRQLRYFVLENYGETDGATKTQLGEWVQKGTSLKYIDHGKGPPPEKNPFLQRVQQVIQASGTQP